MNQQQEIEKLIKELEKLKTAKQIFDHVEKKYKFFSVELNKEAKGLLIARLLNILSGIGFQINTEELEKAANKKVKKVKALPVAEEVEEEEEIEEEETEEEEESEEK